MKDESPESAQILRELSVLEGAPCTSCERPLCGHHALVAMVMGFKSAPRCAGCLAAALELDVDRFLDQVSELVRVRDCYRSGWAWADGREQYASSARPECLKPSDGRAPRKPRKVRTITPGGSSSQPTDGEWDAGSMGCGDLVLELRLRLGRLAPGGILRLTAADPGAPEDIPAWCRLTGHSLLEANHPHYRIRRKES